MKSKSQPKKPGPIARMGDSYRRASAGNAAGGRAKGPYKGVLAADATHDASP
jgi:hypothetical protein